MPVPNQPECAGFIINVAIESFHSSFAISAGWISGTVKGAHTLAKINLDHRAVVIGVSGSAEGREVLDKLLKIATLVERFFHARVAKEVALVVLRFRYTISHNKNARARFEFYCMRVKLSGYEQSHRQI